MRWRGLLVLLAVLAAFVLPLFVLSASALANPESDPSAQDDVGGTPASSDVASPDATPAPEPVTSTGAAVPEPSVIAEAPAAGGGGDPNPPPPPQGAGSAEPDASDPALPRSSDVDPLGAAQPHDHASTGNEAEATSDEAADLTQAALLPALAVASPPLRTESELRAHNSGGKRSHGEMGVARVPWERPNALVPALTPRAWGGRVARRRLRVSASGANRASVPTTTSTENSLGQAPLKGPPPHVPRTPSSSFCGSSSSCAPVFLGMLPLLSALGCLCALLFESLALASSLCRPGRFLSLRERPG